MAEWAFWLLGLLGAILAAWGGWVSLTLSNIDRKLSFLQGEYGARHEETERRLTKLEATGNRC